MSLLSIAVSIVLIFISHFLIKSLCIVCSATYAVNGILCGSAIMDLRKRETGPFPALKNEIGHVAGKWLPICGYILSFGAVAMMLGVMIPSYWLTEASTGPDGLPIGRTDEGMHWIGARQPVLEIVEFSDYQCPYCQRAHAKVRSIVELAPNKIRLVHRHFPLRSHAFARNYAMLAHCAGRQKRFWEANDYLFANGRRKEPVTAKELAAALHIDVDDLTSCLDSDEPREAVAKDVKAGQALRIRGTPTFIIGDKNYPGRIPASVFESLLSN
jgi:predicted DsbA family dithiol-disulfide isomerase